MATLFLIPTPLGEMPMPDWLAPAQLQRVQHLQHFVVETAKVARRHLKTLGLHTPLQQLWLQELNEHTPDHAVAALLAPLQAGHDVGLISDAGCPGLADPGAKLAKRAHQAGFTVCPLAGPSSIVLALMASGSDGQRFSFHGYLPADTATRQQTLKQLEQRSRKEKAAQLFIETPYRNMAMIDSLLQTLAPDTRLTVACDLTLASETIISQPVAKWPRNQVDFHKRPALFIVDSTQ